MLLFATTWPRRWGLVALAAGVVLLAIAPAALAQDRVDFTRTGQGPHVVFVPGLASSGAVWDGARDALQADHTVHVAQVAGFAGAPPSGAASDVLTDIVSDLAAYLADDIPEGAVVVGHSLGGLATLLLAAEHPALVREAVIVDALPFFSVLINPLATPELIEPQAALFAATLRGQTNAEFRASQEAAIDATMVTRPADRERVLAWSLASDRETMAAAGYDVMTTDARPRLSEIRAPVSVLVAWHEGLPFDEAATEAFYAAQYNALDRITVETVPNTKHFIMLDQPAVFEARLRALITD